MLAPFFAYYVPHYPVAVIDSLAAAVIAELL